nr:peroxidase [Actinomycetota bacterium]
LEQFRNDFGAISFTRTAAVPGTGVTSARQQVNTVSSYIDGWNVYGGTDTRLDWLRAGILDGNPSNNSARLLSTAAGYLPAATARGNAAGAPAMELMGRLMGAPASAVIAGDVRANENIALTAVHTLFMREHNRIVGLLPRNLPDETKFQIARRVVSAEIQWITYTEWLPSLGVRLAPYRGYNPNVDASLANEFATVGYRGHSMIHGEFDVSVADGHYSADELDQFEQQGINVDTEDGETTLEVPLNVAFGNPGLLPQIGLGAMSLTLAGHRQYRNDEQIDNQLRSVLFQVPGPDVTDPSGCLDGHDLRGCFRGVLDLGALDIQRARDHGIPSYNELRRAYGLAPMRSFTAITGEATDRFPSDPKIDGAGAINDPDILDFVQLLDGAGQPVEAGTQAAEEDVVTGIRRSTLAARLKAVYGSVDKLDSFVGVVSERHVPGTEFGELQLTMWRRQFQALRDGDRFFYANDPSLPSIRYLFGIDYRQSLSSLIVRDTDVHAEDIQRNVFRVPLN